MPTINDANGIPAEVTDEGRLKVSASTFTMEHHINHHEGQSYSAGVLITPTGPGDCFFYLKNDDDRDLIIYEFMLNAAADETITVKLGDIGTPVGGATVTPINRNAGSGNEADVTALSSVDITGMSGGGAVMGVFLKGGETSIRIAPSSSFIVPKNKILTAYVTTGAISVKVGMGMAFHDTGE